MVLRSTPTQKCEPYLPLARLGDPGSFLKVLRSTPTQKCKPYFALGSFLRTTSAE